MKKYKSNCKTKKIILIGFGLIGSFEQNIFIIILLSFNLSV